MKSLTVASLLIVMLISAFLQAQAHAKSALIIVDMQECFVYPLGDEGGKPTLKNSLPVLGGREIVKGINKIQKKFDLVVATKDWHPKEHWSFASSWDEEAFKLFTLPNKTKQVLWPDHCLQGSEGADFIAGLDTRKVQDIIYKGTHKEVDSYSGFFDNDNKSETILNNYLTTKKIDTVYIVGLATDYCVKSTALHSAKLGYQTILIEDLTRAVNPGQLSEVKSELIKSGVKIMTSSDFEKK